MFDWLFEITQGIDGLIQFIFFIVAIAVLIAFLTMPIRAIMQAVKEAQEKKKDEESFPSSETVDEKEPYTPIPFKDRSAVDKVFIVLLFVALLAPPIIGIIVSIVNSIN